MDERIQQIVDEAYMVKLEMVSGRLEIQNQNGYYVVGVTLQEDTKKSLLKTIATVALGDRNVHLEGFDLYKETRDREGWK